MPTFPFFFLLICEFVEKFLEKKLLSVMEYPIVEVSEIVVDDPVTIINFFEKTVDHYYLSVKVTLCTYYWYSRTV